MREQDSIFAYVMSRLEATDRPLTHIAAATGVKARWLTALRNGRIPEPGVVKIEKLAAYFRDTEAA